MLTVQSYIWNQEIKNYTYTWDKYAQDAPLQHYTSVENDALMQKVAWDTRYLRGFIQLQYEEQQLLGVYHSAYIDFTWAMILQGIEVLSEQNSTWVEGGEGLVYIFMERRNDGEMYFKSIGNKYVDKKPVQVTVEACLPEKVLIEKLLQGAQNFFRIAYQYGKQNGHNMQQYIDQLFQKMN